jgi:hypothetical protein
MAEVQTLEIIPRKGKIREELNLSTVLLTRKRMYLSYVGKNCAYVT